MLFGHSAKRAKMFSKQGSTPTLLGAGPARPNPKMGAPDPENPLFLGFSALRGLPRPPWSRKGPDHGVGVDPETVKCQKFRKAVDGQRGLARGDPSHA